MKFDILDVESLDNYSIEKEDSGCEMCGKNEVNNALAILRYATRESPQEDEIMCEKCLKREGWEIKGVGGYSNMKETKGDNQK